MLVDGYTPLFPSGDFSLGAIFTVHYFEYTSDYVFVGERHDFWEFCYVDKGEISCEADGVEFVLKKGEIIFHKPGEFHALSANGRVAPNLVVASFSCECPLMSWFENKILKIHEGHRTILARMIKEASDAFLSPLDDPDLKHLERSANATAGSEQMVKISLEMFLIELYRMGLLPEEQKQSAPGTVLRIKSQQDFISRVVDYFDENINKRLTLEQVCKDNLVGRSYLQKIFREKTGGGAMEYFGRLKIEAAKRMIREGERNFTEISVRLGYASIHYFSRHFKKIAGMTPSEYSSSVKVLATRDAVSSKNQMRQ